MEVKTDSMNQNDIEQLIKVMNTQMSGLKKLTDLSASGIQRYLHPDVELASLEIHDASSTQHCISSILQDSIYHS